jgi:hypothetical protein
MENSQDHGRVMRYKPKVKTGCQTCRNRRIKCDEAKPICNKCAKSGRPCEGYGPLFRAEMPSSVILGVWVSYSPSEMAGLHELYVREPLHGLTGYNTETRSALLASESEPAIRYALKSMGTLRAEYTRYDDIRQIERRSSLWTTSGIADYSSAIRLLTKRIEGGEDDAALVALHCCLCFISIETLQNTYATAMRHLIQGLKIMQRYRSRPYRTVKDGPIRPARNPHFPQIDVFVLKLFLVPCNGSLTPAGGTRLVQAGVSKYEEIRAARQRMTAIARDTLRYVLNLDKPTAPQTKHQLLQRLNQCETPTAIREADLTVDEAALFLLQVVLDITLRVTLCTVEEGLAVMDAQHDALLEQATWLESLKKKEKIGSY